MFKDGSWDDSGNYRMMFKNINYPDDCKPKSGGEIKKGPGYYVSQFRQGTFNLEWSGRNIVPDSSESDG